MTDQQIILGLRQNDRQTTEYIYKTMGPSVLRYILSNSGTRDDAADYFQEAFIKVLLNIRDGKYKSQEKFEGYFMTIAKNTWLDNLKKKKGKHVDDDDNSLLKLADDSDEEALLQLILHDKRLTVLNTVWESDTWQGTECHRILNAQYFEKKRTKSIADTEGVPLGTILPKLATCKKKLFAIVSKLL